MVDCWLRVHTRTCARASPQDTQYFAPPIDVNALPNGHFPTISGGSASASASGAHRAQGAARSPDYSRLPPIAGADMPAANAGLRGLEAYGGGELGLYRPPAMPTAPPYAEQQVPFCAQSRCRGGGAEPGPGADVVGPSPVPAQRFRRMSVRARIAPAARPRHAPVRVQATERFVAVRCTLSAACFTLHVACCMLQPGGADGFWNLPEPAAPYPHPPAQAPAPVHPLAPQRGRAGAVDGYGPSPTQPGPQPPSPASMPSAAAPRHPR